MREFDRLVVHREHLFANAPLVALAAGMIAGCSSNPTVRTPASRPIAASATVTPGAELQVVEVRLGPKRARPEAVHLGFTVELRARLQPGEGIERAYIAPIASAPCQGGVADKALWIDDELAEQRPKDVSPQGRVELEFPHRDVIPVLRDGSAVDLEIRGENDTVRCVRAVLARAPDFALEPKPTLSFGGRLRVHVPLTTAYNTSSATTLGFALGKWAGPIYLDVFAGLGLGFCHGCAENDGGFFGLPLGVEMKNYLFEGPGYALGWGVGYLGIPGFFPNEAVWIHAPRASLIFARSAPAPSGFPSNLRSEAFGIELFGERWIYRLSGRTEQANFLGLGIFFDGAM